MRTITSKTLDLAAIALQEARLEIEGTLENGGFQQENCRRERQPKCKKGYDQKRRRMSEEEKYWR